MNKQSFQYSMKEEKVLTFLFHYACGSLACCAHHFVASPSGRSGHACGSMVEQPKNCLTKILQRPSAQGRQKAPKKSCT